MKKWTRIILGVLILLTIFVWTEIAKSPSADVLDQNVHVFFLNVGQGDAELIEKGNYQILIDGGPDDTVLSQVGNLMPISDRKIEILILTHPHADHLVGINQILDRYEVGMIYYSGADYDSAGYKEFLSKIQGKTIRIPDLEEKLEPFPNSNLTFLWPGKKFEGKTNENLNNVSEVVKFCYLSHCALFTGDIEVDGQAEIIDYYSAKNLNGIFHSDLLKIPHHGSVNGTNQTLLDMVKPRMAVIEVGADNNYGHPHAPTLDLLKKNNIQMFRTDHDGAVEFILSEAGITIK